MSAHAVLIILGVVPCLLRGELLPIRTYTTADGLASDHITCIVPDSRGFLWFCTPEGLSRFDGYHFVSYGSRDGLASNAVSRLIETRHGEYLIGTGRGVSRILKGARFANYMPEAPGAQNYVRG